MNLDAMLLYHVNLVTDVLSDRTRRFHADNREVSSTIINVSEEEYAAS